MLETYLKVELLKEIVETARNSYKRGIFNIASLQLAQNKLLSKSCVHDEIHSGIMKHLSSCNDSSSDSCHALIGETRNHIEAIKSEHEYLSKLAFLNKLHRRDNTMIDVKIPQAGLPNQILQDNPNVMNFMQDSVKRKEKLLLKIAKTFNEDDDAAQKDEQQQLKPSSSWLCSETPSRKRKTYRPTTPPPLPPSPPPPPLPLSPQPKDKDKE